MDVLNLVLTIVSIVYFWVCRWLQCKEYVRHDVAIEAQEDYAIFVRDVPIWVGKDCKYEENIKEVF